MAEGWKLLLFTFSGVTSNMGLIILCNLMGQQDSRHTFSRHYLYFVTIRTLCGLFNSNYYVRLCTKIHGMNNLNKCVKQNSEFINYGEGS